MQQEFEPKLPRDILKLSKNKSFYFRLRFGAIYSVSKTKKYLLRWLDIVFQSQYLPSLSANYVAINKDLETLTPQLY